MACGDNQNQNKDQKVAMMQQEMKITKSMDKIKYKIAVMSGKGGVGKSTVTVNLASAFNKEGLKTGILDADLHGPNVPNMFGIGKEDLKFTKEHLMPAETESGIKVISSDLLLPSTDTPLIWRGSKKSGAIRQFLSDVKWDSLDVLLIDNPPGTGDEPLTVLQSIPNIDGIVIVTTPQSVALEDVRKCINMAKIMEIKILGIIENMSGFICPECSEEILIFGKGGGEEIAKEFDIPFLGSLPIDISTYKSSEEGKTIVENDSNSKISKKILKISKSIINNL